MKSKQIVKTKLFFFFALLLPMTVFAAAPSHPKLLLNAEDVKQMVAAKDTLPAFEQAYLQLKSSLDPLLLSEMDVPMPKDAGGGYTHEQHKKVYKAIYDAGLLFQITGDKKYVDFSKKLFFAYADMYPGLGTHPKPKEQAPGRLFWQTLNECVWLVYSIQGYDAIASALTDKERARIENNVLLPMATFLSEESPLVFNKIHNHGTWAVAAVGMTGYVLGNQALVDKALLGLDRRGDAGFLKQLDILFSPDGYYTEGPYYQRYALMPFILFAKAIQNNEPERKIFEYRDGILTKAVYTAIQLSYADFFFPINDALKDKGLDTIELVHAVSIIYGLTKDPSLLSIAKVQHTISVSGDGVRVAKGLSEKSEKPFPFKTMLLRDGTDGDEGGLGILRSGYEEGHMAVVAKNTAQGLGHGHFDKLALLVYDNDRELVSDYGAARFLNVESKYGGHYLKENDTWAKQTIAHSTAVVDETSHSSGNYDKAKDLHPVVDLFDATDSIDITSARMLDAYDDVVMARTVALVKSDLFEHPLILDVFTLESDAAHQYDLPLYINGHIVNSNFPITAATQSLTPFGKANGYEFLWHRAWGKTQNTPTAQVTWLLNDRFYTLSSDTDEKTSLHFVELGANDPNFNLRKESGLIRRVKGSKDHTFVSALEAHGEYNPALEFTRNSYSSIREIKRFAKGGLDYIRVETKTGKTLGLALSYNADEGKSHKMNIDGKSVKWKGFYRLFEE